MAAATEIAWTDMTFNPWRGCTKVAAGCTNCYADTLSKRNPKTLGTWGPNGTRVVAAENYWREPEKWNRYAVDPVASAMRTDFPRRPRVFCASLADVFEDWAGPMVDAQGEMLYWSAVSYGERWHWIGESHTAGVEDAVEMADVRQRLFHLIDATPHLDWLILTKRPENIRGMWPAVSVNTQEQADDRSERGELFRRNVWLLTSVATQENADRNIPQLLACRDLVPVLGASAEPLLEEIDLAVSWEGEPTHPTLQLDWIIAGGESGHGARPCDIAWVRSLRDQCQAAGVPCFVKQLGANVVSTHRRDFRPFDAFGMEDRPEGIPFVLKDKKGGDPEEWPADLRVREFPR